MNTAIYSSVLQSLQQQGVAFREGLSEEEFQEVEHTYQFRFPPDLKAFLSIGLPVSDGFINWREGNRGEIKKKCSFLIERVLSDIAYRDFWFESWGVRPCLPDMAREVALGQLSLQPKMIPLYQFDYLPEKPYEVGNPIVSYRQGHFILRGNDLFHYFQKEFQIDLPAHAKSGESKEITFWSALIR